MAETNEICYSGIGATTPDCIEQPTKSTGVFFPENDRFRRIGGLVKDVSFNEEYLDSTIGYLDYSAFFLTRYKFIERDFETDDDPESYDQHFGLHNYSAGFRPSPGLQAPVATWKGGMIGALGSLEGSPPNQHSTLRSCAGCELSALRATEMPALITGDVTLTTKLGPTELDQESWKRGEVSIPPDREATHFLSLDITFENVAGGGERYDNWTWTIEGREEFAFCPLGYGCGSEPSTIVYEGKDGTLAGAFYGPGFEEAGGIFRRVFERDAEGKISKHMHGAFGAKRQPE